MNKNKNQSPYRLYQFVERVLSTQSVEVGQKELDRWLISPVTTALQAHLIDRLCEIWTEMRIAKDEQHFHALNGEAMAIEELLDWKPNVSAEPMTEEAASSLRQQTEDFLNGHVTTDAD